MIIYKIYKMYKYIQHILHKKKYTNVGENFRKPFGRTARKEKGKRRLEWPSKWLCLRHVSRVAG